MLIYIQCGLTVNLINHPFFFLCPSCFSENTFRNSQCLACHKKIEIHDQHINFGNQQINFTEYYNLIERELSIKKTSFNTVSSDKLNSINDALRISKEAELRQGNQLINFIGYHKLYQRKIEKPVIIGEGYLAIFKDYVEFISEIKRWKWPVNQFSCVTTNGYYFEFKIKHKPFYQIKFLHESPLKYEIIFRNWLKQFYHNSDEKRIVEFQPRIIFSSPQQFEKPLNFSSHQHSEQNYFFEKISINVIQFIIRTLLRFWLKVRIISRENWETVRNGFTLLNHQSALDPFIVGAFLDRKIAFLTKDTSFTHWLPRFFLKWLMGIPTTRYQTDPEVIYFIRKLLNRGINIGIFPEGERTWSGKLHSFKLSLVKLLMASREAITPIILHNAFYFWPRWAKFPHKKEVQIVIEAPFCLIPEIYTVEEQQKFLEEYYKIRLNEKS